MSQQEPFEEWRSPTPEEVARLEERKHAAVGAAKRTAGTRTKHLRLAIDFHSTITGTPPDDDGLNEPDPIYHARQVRICSHQLWQHYRKTIKPISLKGQRVATLRM